MVWSASHGNYFSLSSQRWDSQGLITWNSGRHGYMGSSFQTEPPPGPSTIFFKLCPGSTGKEPEAQQTPALSSPSW